MRNEWVNHDDNTIAKRCWKTELRQRLLEWRKMQNLLEAEEQDLVTAGCMQDNDGERGVSDYLLFGWHSQKYEKKQYEKIIFILFMTWKMEW